MYFQFPAKQCDDLIVDNAEILWRPSMYHFQDIIDIQCLLGFEMVGESTLECLSDGSWNTTIPTCERTYKTRLKKYNE